ncbi:MAG: hypothetical protein PHN78_06710 [Dehalococcoidales bacterium]|nr:hypothetical protein [Dehalococcoidales bacterium]
MLIPFKFKESTKKSYAAQDFGTKGRLGKLANTLLYLAGSVNIDTGFGISFVNLLYLLKKIPLVLSNIVNDVPFDLPPPKGLLLARG